MRRKLLILPLLVGADLLLQGAPAFACGALVAPDGDVRLSHVTTFVAWHDGVEHYLTSFAYQGSVSDLGWIVPLPAAPVSIEAGGRWTLQRLEREVNPQPLAATGLAGAVPDSAQVIEQVQVEALDVTVVKGSGPAILDWAQHNGFPLAKDVHDHLLTYARATPYFMAAKYDLSAARARGLLQGDGVPLLLTMHTPQAWVPLEVLGNDNAPVQADVFVLSDGALRTGTEPIIGIPPFSAGRELPGAPGFVLRAQEPMNDALYRDLSGDRNMSWVWRGSWLTYLQLNARADLVTYDMGVTRDGLIRLASSGTPPALVGSAPAQPPFVPDPPLVDPGLLFLALGVLAVGVLAGGAALACRGSRARA